MINVSTRSRHMTHPGEAAVRSEPSGARIEGRPRLLVVEDEPRISSFISHGMMIEGFATRVATDADEAFTGLQAFNPDLLLLDLVLPGVDGLQLLRSIREQRWHLPVIVLSGRGDVATKLAAFRGGATDYVVKPFSFDELVARVKIHLEKRGPGPDAFVLRAGEFVFDTHTRTVDVGARHISLTERECQVLEYLMRHRKLVISRERILSAVWGYDFSPNTNVVDVCVKRLRDKVGRAWIETVRQVGYRFTG